jgi:serine/threonine protein phosphatase PrpC
MEDEDILRAFSAERPNPDTLQRVVDEVNARGGPDNVTLAVVVFSEEPDASETATGTP